MSNTILCVRWGDKYGPEYVEKLKLQCEEKCSSPFNFYCLTDNPTEVYDRPLPKTWDRHENGNFWAYRKLYMFDEDKVNIKGNNFLYLDLQTNHGIHLQSPHGTTDYEIYPNWFSFIASIGE